VLSRREIFAARGRQAARCTNASHFRVSHLKDEARSGNLGAQEEKRVLAAFQRELACTTRAATAALRYQTPAAYAEELPTPTGAKPAGIVVAAG
jgi:hypothetical protein